MYKRNLCIIVIFQTVRIDHLDGDYYIACGIDDEGIYRFTDSRIGVCVFKDKDLALSVFENNK